MTEREIEKTTQRWCMDTGEAASTSLWLRAVEDQVDDLAFALVPV